MNESTNATNILSRVVAAIGAGIPDSALARVLEVVREAFGAQAAVALRKVDAVTAFALASAPENALPAGITHASVLDTALAAGRPIFNVQSRLEVRNWRGLPATAAIFPWIDPRMSGAVIVLRSENQPFTPEEIQDLESVAATFYALALLRHKITMADAMRSRFDTIFRTIPNGLVFVDEDGAEAWVNHRAAEILSIAAGTTEPARVARAMNGLWSRAERPDELRKKIIEVIAGPDKEMRDLRWNFPGASRRVYSISTFPTGRDDYRGRLWLFIDITERQIDREELEAKNLALEVARREADQANAAKSRFLATMSHEIRTPMNGVLGMTGILLDGHLEPAQRDIVETIRSSGDALLTIINDILDFSKIEAGLMEFEKQPFSLRQCLDDVLDLIAPQARKKALELGVMVDLAVPTAIFGDVTRLRQVLVNLVGNAVKFTAAGEVIIEVHLIQATHTNDRMLQFTIRDTGIGIPSDRLDRLFLSFSQVDATINRKFGGTGLGLAICKRLVELMSGTIWVESKLGEGTTFFFTIATSVADPESTGISEAMSLAGRDLQGKQVLIIDDNATNRRVLSLQARGFGLEPIAVASGREGLDLLRQCTLEVRVATVPYSLVLIDVHMPGMDGFEVARAIRNDLRLATLPIVFVSSTDLVANHELDELDATCLTKPIKQSSLFDVIMRSLSLVTVRTSRLPPPITFDNTLGQRIPLRILLAEDNAVNQKVALLILSRLGYRADCAANGYEVLDAVTKRPYDVILMDVHMPELDGLEATRRLRRKGPWLTSPRIIAMTADVMQEGREACMEAGMDDFVSKPIRLAELVAAIERCSGIRATESSPGRMAPPSERSSLVSAEEPVIDDEIFDNLRMVCELGGSGTLAVLVTDFLSDSKRLLDEVQDAASRGDWELLERLAHTLKGTSGMFGAKIMARHFESIEMMSRRHDASNLNTLVALAAAERSRVQDTLVQRCFF